MTTEMTNVVWALKKNWQLAIYSGDENPLRLQKIPLSLAPGVKEEFFHLSEIVPLGFSVSAEVGESAMSLKPGAERAEFLWTLIREMFASQSGE